jgi:hypothetical protein
MHKYTVLFFALWALAPACRAVETKTWTENDQSDFEKGTLTKLSLRNDGRLTLAPVFKEIVDTSMPYLWALARDSKGNLYAGGGGPGGTQAKLFVIDAAGKSKVLAELPGMEIHTIAVNSHGQVFAATAPDGKVYRIGSDGKPDVFYDPHAKYIWAMAFNSTGDLFVATGDEGEIHKVSADGKGAVFFRTEETHARSMAIDGEDNLIVGTEPSGLIVRISTKGEGFVLYQAAKREITAVAVAPDGSIYAAGVGNKTPGAPAPAPAPALPVPPANISAGPRGNAPASPPAPAAIAGGSEVYRIEKDGAPRKVWSQAQDLVYAISFDGEGKPVIGTGNKGKIYRIDSPLISTLLINTLPTQVTNLLAAPGGKIYATTGNVGRLYQLGPELEKQGTYESSAFDAGFFSYWGRLSYLGSDGNGRVTFETRSGNLDRPQKNWSSWSKVDTAGASRIGSPSAQFVQYRATIATTGTSGKAATPEILEVDIAYQQKNVAPVIEEIEITPSNYKFPAPVSLTAASQNLTLPPMGQHRKSPGSGLDALSSQAMTYAKGYAGARWAAIDPNGDELVYTVEIRGVKESAWKVLREKVKERYVSWDSTAFPDGEYLLRVTASDAPANPAGTELKNQLESDRVMIDNTPPQISGLAGSRNGKKITVNWKAKDALSEIHKAEYSLDGKDWTLLEPTTRLSDSLEHEYLLNVDDVSPGEHTVAVRVADEYDNQAVDKIVVR